MFKVLNRIRRFVGSQQEILQQLDRMSMALGRVEARQTTRAASLQEAEFQVSSQWGEDGIIEYLLDKVLIERPIFVEFGIQDYKESNTRFLLQHRNWAGLVIDGSAENIAIVKSDPIYWRYNLKALAAFIDRDNINSVIAEGGIAGDIGILSIDIDGNDYWVWEAITVISPRIVVAEYNSLFGPKAKITVPYDQKFQRTAAHHSNLYWGASICALAHLGELKGYVLVGSNSAGNNVFFVRGDLCGSLKPIAPVNAWVQAQFRESRSADGTSTFLSFEQAQSQILNMPVWDLGLNRALAFKETLR